MTQAYNLSQFANFLNASGQVSAAGIQSGVVVSSGTVMLFYQAAAPTGWTQITSLNDYDLRLTSGAGGSTGGTTAYSTVFTNQTVSTSVSVSVSGTTGGTTLSTAQLASHTHPITTLWLGESGSGFTGFSGGGNAPIGAVHTGAEGGNAAHSHSFSGSGSGTGTSSAITLNVRYANIIICSKN